MSVLKNLSVTSCVFMAVFVLSIASARNKPEPSEQNDAQSKNELLELFRDIQKILEMKMTSKMQQESEENDMDGDKVGEGEQLQCSCSGMVCSCCHELGIPKFYIHLNCCLKVTYEEAQSKIYISLTVGSYTFFNKDIDAKHPPPLCVSLPYALSGGTGCIEFYNLRVTGGSLSGCASFKITLWYVTLVNFSLGCFQTVSVDAAEEVGSVELPSLDEQQEAPVEGPEPIYLGEVTMEKEPFYLRNVLLEKIKQAEHKKK